MLINLLGDRARIFQIERQIQDKKTEINSIESRADLLRKDIDALEDVLFAYRLKVDEIAKKKTVDIKQDK